MTVRYEHHTFFSYGFSQNPPGKVSVQQASAVDLNDDIIDSYHTTISDSTLWVYIMYHKSILTARKTSCIYTLTVSILQVLVYHEKRLHSGVLMVRGG